jgi:hypothetical protein
VTTDPLTTIEKALAAAVVTESASLNTSVTSVPATLVVAETNVGPTESALLVTLVAASVAASLPDESCTALKSFPAVGSVYATVTVCPDDTAVASVNTTVEPDTTALLTERDTPSTVTANADVAAAVALNASEYVSVTVVPNVFTAADTNVGALTSTVELFVTLVAASDAASLPDES